jgi:hypothetical protein
MPMTQASAPVAGAFLLASECSFGRHKYCLEEFPRWRTLDNLTSARKNLMRLMLMRLLTAKLKLWWATRYTRAAMKNTFRR